MNRLLWVLLVFAFPSFSRADLVLQRIAQGVTTGTDSTSSKQFSFVNNSSSSNPLTSMSFLLTNNAASNATLKLQFGVGGSTFQKLATFTGTGDQTLTFDISGWNYSAIGDATTTLDVSFVAATGGAANGTDIFYNNTTANFSGGPTADWSGSATGSAVVFGLSATVPEPTTMILTGSVLVAGFGASMLRRFRKKPETQEAAA